MKKIHANRRLWILRQQLISKLKQNRIFSQENKKNYKLKKPKISIIQIPANLLAEKDEHRQLLLKTIKSIASILITKNSCVRLDFTKVKKLYPGGTLVFLAHLEKLIAQYPGRIKARCQPKSLSAQLLGHFGIAPALGVAPDSCIPTHESVVKWTYLTGTTADGSKISALLKEYREITDTEPPEGLYDALTEALTNVRHHAYPELPSASENKRRWWLFARYDVHPINGNGNLYIAVYDVGVGIQSSMRNRLHRGEIILDRTDELFPWARLDRKILARLLLKRAIENKRSSTGLSHRGKGLPEMREFVMNTHSGRMYIISGQAQYTCVAATAANNCESCHDVFPGTLILWNVPL